MQIAVELSLTKTSKRDVSLAIVNGSKVINCMPFFMELFLEPIEVLHV